MSALRPNQQSCLPVKVFHCDHCGNLLFFESSSCVGCGRQVAYLPDIADVGSLDVMDDGRWRSPLGGAAGRVYRLCANYLDLQVCNWAVPDQDSNPLCASCRLTRVLPDLSTTDARSRLYKLEGAKRRLVFTLSALSLPIRDRQADPDHGLAFEFKADDANGAGPVLTGHADGVITVNTAEADDPERERRRLAVHEPYRTLLGHMRHESGHYYWDRLIKATAELDPFRALFGDERVDYPAALDTHYQQGPPADWSSRFVSAYASAHAWEDWAETWAHYLHMVDTLETAAACGLSLRPRRADEPALARVPPVVVERPLPFDRLLDGWFPLTYVLNNFNRGLGLPDAYPFVLSGAAIEKLRFVHDVVARHRTLAA